VIAACRKNAFSIAQDLIWRLQIGGSIAGGQGEYKADELLLAAGFGFGEDALDVEAGGIEREAQADGDDAGFEAEEQEVGDTALGGSEAVKSAENGGAGR
jgi:hypothetical protein